MIIFVTFVGAMRLATLVRRVNTVEFIEAMLLKTQYPLRRKNESASVLVKNKVKLEMLDSAIEHRIEEIKNRLTRLKEAIVSNKDLFIFLGQLAAGIHNEQLQDSFVA